jgi:hypothetical protein
VVASGAESAGRYLSRCQLDLVPQLPACPYGAGLASLFASRSANFASKSLIFSSFLAISATARATIWM